MNTPRWEWIGPRSANKAWHPQEVTATIRHINHHWYRWTVRQHGKIVRSGSVQGRSEVVNRANKEAEGHLSRRRMHMSVYANVLGRW